MSATAIKTCTCGMCGIELYTDDIELHIDRDEMTEDELQSILNGQHKQYLVLCDDCMMLFTALDDMDNGGVIH